VPFRLGHWIVVRWLELKLLALRDVGFAWLVGFEFALLDVGHNHGHIFEVLLG
jgi:hypothetical protein